MIDFSGVKVGDRVRISRANGDEVTFMVTELDDGYGELRMGWNSIRSEDWDTIEVLPKPLPTEPGYYLDKDGDLWRITVGTPGILQYACPVHGLERGGSGCAKNADKYAPYTRLVEVSS